MITGLCMYIQITMLTRKWNACDSTVIKFYFLHVIDLCYAPESYIIKHEFQVGVLQFSTGCSWYNDVPYFMTQWKQCFKQNMVLVIMRDQYIIDNIGQINI